LHAQLLCRVEAAIAAGLSEEVTSNLRMGGNWSSLTSDPETEQHGFRRGSASCRIYPYLIRWAWGNKYP
jgi:hypothetical protein